MKNISDNSNNSNIFNKKHYFLSASLLSVDLLNIGAAVKEIENSGIDYIHFDVMDGLFVPRYGLHPEMLKAVRSITSLPIDVHMMTENPEPYIPAFAKAGATIIAVHAESCKHLHRAVKTIRGNGVQAGVALNFTTPLNVLDYILDDINLIILMAINPGIVGHELIPNALKKISDLRKKLDEAGAKHIIIEIDGGVNFESAPKMIKAGANMLVCGSQSIFRPGEKLSDKVKKLKSIINR